MKNKRKITKKFLILIVILISIFIISGYLDSKGKVTCNNIGEVKKGTIPLLLQYDTRWDMECMEMTLLQ